MIAVIIVYLEENGNKRFYEKYISMSNSDSRKHKNTIRSKFPEMFQGEEMNEYKINIHNKQERIDFTSRLHQFVTDCKSEKLIFTLAVLAEVLDMAIVDTRESFFSISINDFIKIDALNNNHNEEKISLLPRYACSWEHNNRAIYHGLGINNVILKHSYYIKQAEADEYNIKSVIMKSTLNSRVNVSTNLAVGVSPVTNEELLEIYETNDEEGYGLFEIKSLKNVGKINDKILRILNDAIKQKVEILVFPEMLGSEELVEEVSEFLERHGNGYPVITVLPSIWRDNRNVSVVVDSTGEEIFRQNKHERYYYSKEIENSHGEVENKKFWENITSDNNIYLLHWKGVGRIVVAICKDYLQTSYTDYLIQKLYATLIICPSFSTGSYNFQTVVERGHTFDCNTIWINTCAASNLRKNGFSDEDIIASITNFGTDSTGSIRIQEHKITKQEVCSCEKCEASCLSKKYILM